MNIHAQTVASLQLEIRAFFPKIKSSIRELPKDPDNFDAAIRCYITHRITYWKLDDSKKIPCCKIASISSKLYLAIFYCPLHAELNLYLTSNCIPPVLTPKHVFNRMPYPKGNHTTEFPNHQLFNSRYFLSKNI